MLLQNERQRYDALESDYQTLLGQVEKLQNSHSVEISTILKKSKTAQRALGHALDLKSLEIVELNRHVKEWQSRYADESAKWVFANQGLKEKFHPLEVQVNEIRGDLESKEKIISKLKGKLTQSVQNYETKQDELNRFVKSFRRTESSFNKEREAWLDLKMELSDKNRELETLKKENEDLKLGQSKSNQTITDISSLKPVLDEAKRKIQILLEREQGYLDKLEDLFRENTQCLQENQVLKDSMQSLEKEFLVLNGNYGISLKEIQSLRISNQENLDLNSKLNNTKDQDLCQINDLASKLDLLKTENIKNQEKASGLSRLNEELTRQNRQLQKEIEYSKTCSGEYYNRIESLMQEKSAMSSTLLLVQQDLYDLTNRFQEQSELLDLEKSSKAGFIKENSIKFQNVTCRINNLQSTIEETSKLLAEYKNNEITLRGNLSERNDLLQEKELEILQLRNSCISLQDSLSNQSKEFKDVTESRKLQVSRLSEMYESDLESFKTKISNLLSELESKKTQINESKIEVTNLKYENASLVGEISHLRSELQKGESGETSLKSRLESLESLISTFESQVSMYKSKISSLESQISVLEKESQISKRNFSFEPLSLGKLQEKLTQQLDSIVENQF